MSNEPMYEVPLSRLNEMAEEIRSLHQELRDRDRAHDAAEELHHNWAVAGINRPPEDVQPVHPRSVFNLSQVFTYVLLRCIDCGWLCSLQLVGNWTEDQLKGMNHGSDTTTD